MGMDYIEQWGQENLTTDSSGNYVLKSDGSSGSSGGDGSGGFKPGGNPWEKAAKAWLAGSSDLDGYTLDPWMEKDLDAGGSLTDAWEEAKARFSPDEELTWDNYEDRYNQWWEDYEKLSDLYKGTFVDQWADEDATSAYNDEAKEQALRLQAQYEEFGNFLASNQQGNGGDYYFSPEAMDNYNKYFGDIMGSLAGLGHAESTTEGEWSYWKHKSDGESVEDWYTNAQENYNKKSETWDYWKGLAETKELTEYEQSKYDWAKEEFEKAERDLGYASTFADAELMTQNGQEDLLGYLEFKRPGVRLEDWLDTATADLDTAKQNAEDLQNQIDIYTAESERRAAAAKAGRWNMVRQDENEASPWLTQSGDDYGSISTADLNSELEKLKTRKEEADKALETANSQYAAARSYGNMIALDDRHAQEQAERETKQAEIAAAFDQGNKWWNEGLGPYALPDHAELAAQGVEPDIGWEATTAGLQVEYDDLQDQLTDVMAQLRNYGVVNQLNGKFTVESTPDEHGVSMTDIAGGTISELTQTAEELVGRLKDIGEQLGEAERRVQGEAGYQDSVSQGNIDWQKYVDDFTENTAKKLGRQREAAYHYTLDGVEYTVDDKTQEELDLVRETAEQEMMGALAEVAPNENWSKEDEDWFYFLFHSEEEGLGREAAFRFGEQVNRELNKARRDEQTAGWYKAGAGYDNEEDGKSFGHWLSNTARGGLGLLGAIADLPAGTVSWFDKIDSNINSSIAFNGEVYDAGHENAWVSDYLEAWNAGRSEQLNKNNGVLPENIPVIGGKGLGDLHQVAQSMIQSWFYGKGLASAAMSAGVASTAAINTAEATTLALFFGNAANQAYDQALWRGASPTQAGWVSFFSGCAEVLGEKISLDHFLKNGSWTWKMMLKQGLIEGSEEVTTEGLNLFGDLLAAKMTDGRTAIEQDIIDLMNEGYSYGDACKKVWRDKAFETGWEFVSGALSGMGSGGGMVLATAANAAHGAMNYKGSGRNSGENLINEARSKGGEAAALADNLEGKRMSNARAQKLYEAIQNADRGTITQAVTEQLQTRDSSLQDQQLTDLSTAITAAALRQATPEQIAQIEGNETAKNILYELTTGFGQQGRAQWARDLKTTRVNPGAVQRQGAEDMVGENLPADFNRSVDVNGEKLTISGITEHGMVQAKNSKGETVDVKVEDLSESQQAVVAYMKNRYGTKAWDMLRTAQLSNGNLASTMKALDLIWTFSQNASRSFDEDMLRRNMASLASALSTDQMRAAWDLAREEQEQHEKKYRAAGKVNTQKYRNAVNGLIFHADGHAFEGFNIHSKELTAQQKGVIRLCEKLSEASGGRLRFNLYHGEGLGIYGAYDNGVIHLDMDHLDKAGRFAVTLTLAHELTHYIESFNRADYNGIRDFMIDHLMEAEGVSLEELINRKIARQPGLHRQGAISEIIADGCEMMLQDGSFIRELAEQNLTWAQKLSNFVTKFLNDVTKALNTAPAIHDEAKTIQAYADELQKMWNNALKGALKSETGVVTDEQYSRAEVSEETRQAVREGRAIPVDQEIAFSRAENDNFMQKAEDYNHMVQEMLDQMHTEAEDFEAWWKQNKKETSLTKSQARNIWMNAHKMGRTALDPKVLQQAREVRQLIADYFNQHEEALNLPPDVMGDTFLSNSSYDGSEENTTVCIRSLAAQALMDRIGKKLGRPLTVDETLLLSQEIANYTEKPECFYCYVATDRRAYREYLGDYLKQRDAFLKNLSAEDRQKILDLEEHAAKKGAARKAARKGLPTAYLQFLGTREDTDNMRARVKMWLNTAQEQLITGSDLASLDELTNELARLTDKQNRTAAEQGKLDQLKDAAEYAQSASWAKKVQGYTAYNNHILSWSEQRINRLNSHYGLRMYSFSDFSAAFILENMQMVTDASVRGLKLLAYTKEAAFAEIFARTGMNINVSVFASEVEGQIIEDGMMGADWKQAIDLRNRYPNVGITLVATNDRIVEWGLQNPNVDVVIPYHLVRTGQAVADYFQYKNYTAESADGKLKLQEGQKRRATSVYPSVHQNDLVKYVRALNRNHLTPRFERYLNGWKEFLAGEMSEAEFRAANPYYMKLVNETRRSAGETPAVQPIFNEQAAMKAIKQMEKRGGYGIAEVFGRRSDYVLDKITDKVAENIQANRQFSKEDIETGRESEGRVQFSVDDNPREVTTAKVAELAQRCADHEFDDDTYIPVRASTPRIFIEEVARDSRGIIKLEDLPWAMQVFHVRQELGETDEQLQQLIQQRQTSNEVRPHELEPEEFAAILERADKPDQIVLQNNKNGRRYAEIIAYTAKTGKEFVAVIDVGPLMRGEYKGPDIMNGYQGGDYYVIVTVYAPDSMQQYYETYVERIIYEKNSDPRVGSGSLVPLRSFESLFFEDSITNIEQKSKRESRRENDRKHKNKRQWSREDVGEYIPYNRRAVVSEETLDLWMDSSHFGASNPNYAQAYITYMKPSDFLNLSTIYDMGRIRSETEPLDEAKIKEAVKGDPIKLKIDTETGEVLDHEGRHRMMALQREGIERVPVLLFDFKNKNSKVKMDSLLLRGQEFNGRLNSARVTVSDIIPLNQAHRQEIIDKFSKQESFERGKERLGIGRQMRFSMADVVEETDKLVAVHNVTEDKLRGALKLGGLPVPSIAIVKAKSGHSNYGPISLVFNKQTVDPKANRKNKVYGGDAWTPMMREVEYQIDTGKVVKFEQRIRDLSKKIAGGIFESASVVRQRGIDDVTNLNMDELLEKLAGDDAVRAAYAADNGIQVEPETLQKEFHNYGNAVLRQFIDRIGEDQLQILEEQIETGEDISEEYMQALRDVLLPYYATKSQASAERRLENFINRNLHIKFINSAYAYMQSNGEATNEIDRLATSNKLREAVSDKDVKEWLRPQLEGVIGEPGIRNEKDRFTPSGARRSFWQTHDTYTLANVVKAMTTGNSRGAGIHLGATHLQSITAKDYTSLEEVKKDSGRLRKTSEEEYSAEVSKVDAQLEDLVKAIAAYNNDSSYMAREVIGETIIEAARGSRTVSGLQQSFQRLSEYKLSKELAQQLIDAYDAAANLPTEYFEAKPQRAVGFDEVAAAILPDNVSEDILTGLREAGVDVRTYENGNEQARLQQLNGIENVQFSREDVAEEDLERKLAESEAARGKLEKAIQTAQKQLEFWRNEADQPGKKGIYKANPRDVQRFAKGLLEEYPYTTVKASQITERIQKIADGFMNQEDTGDLYRIALDIAEEIIENSYVRIDNEMNLVGLNGTTDADLIKQHLKGYIYVAEQDRADIASQLRMENFEQVRRRFFKYGIYLTSDLNKATRGKSLRTIDSLYEELAPSYGWKAGMMTISEMMEIIDAAITEDVVNPYYDVKSELSHMDIDHVAELAETIFEGAISEDVRQYFTRAEKAARQLDEAKANAAEQKLQARERLEAERENNRQALKRERQRTADVRKRLAATRATDAARLRALREQKNRRMNEIIQEERRKRRDLINRNRENRERRETRQKIWKLQKEAQQLVSRPTEKAYVPANLMRAMAEMLSVVSSAELRQQESRMDRIDRQLEEMSMTEEQHGKKAAYIQRAIDRLGDLQAKYEAISKDEMYAYTYNEAVKGMLDQLKTYLYGTHLTDGDMSADTLKQIYNIMNALMYTVKNANKLTAMEYQAGIRDLAKELNLEMNQADAKRGLLGTYEKSRMWQMRPDTFFRYICGYAKDSIGEKIQQMFVEGTQRKLTMQRDFYNMFQGITESRNAEERKIYNDMTQDPLKQLVSWGLRDVNGEEVFTTRGMMLQAYMLLEQEDSARSLAIGGFLLPNLKEYYHGNYQEAFGKLTVRTENRMAEYGDLLREARELKESMEGKTEKEQLEIEQQIQATLGRANEILAEATGHVEQLKQNIEDQLTAFDKKIIQTAHEWYDYSGKKLDETNMDLYGFKKQRPKGYVPIHRDLTSVMSVDIRDMQNTVNLENAGFTKSRVKSTNPIMLTDILMELDGNQARMSNFYGFVKVQHDFNAIWKCKVPGSTMTIEGKVSEKFGKGQKGLFPTGAAYVENYVRSVAGGANQVNLMSGLYGNAAAATLSLNPKVALSQLASIPTAAAELGWMPVMKGLARGLQTGMSTKAKQELAQKSVWFWQRYRGEGGMREFAEIKNNRGTAVGRTWNKIASTKAGSLLLNWCQDMDTLATASMWAMAEEYVKARGVDISTEEGQQAVSDAYRDVIRKTQPNYTATERSDLLREQRAGIKFLTMYKTQSNQNLNILMEANGEFIRARKDLKAGAITQEDMNAATAKLARSYSAVIIGGSLTYAALRTVASFLMGALSGYRDDDDELTAESIRKGTMKEFYSSLAGMDAFTGIVYDLLYSSFSGEKYYGISDNAMGALSDVLTGAYKTIQAIMDDEEGNAWEAVHNELKNLCTLAGIPLGNAEKFISAAKMYYNDLQNGTFGQFEGNVERKPAQEAHRLLNAFRDGDEEKAAQLFQALQESQKGGTDWKRRQQAESFIKNQVKTWYVDDADLTEDQAREILTTYGGMTEDEANEQLREWLGVIENGYDYGDAKDAFISGDLSEDELRIYAATYMGLKGQDLEDAVVNLSCERDTGYAYKDLMQAYVDGAISEQEAVEYRMKYGGYNKAEAEDTVTKWRCEKETGVAYSRLEDAFVDGVLTKQQAVTLQVKYGGKTMDKAEEAVMKWACEKDNGIKYSDIEEAYIAGKVTKQQVVSWEQKYGGRSRDKAEEYLARYEFARKTGVEWSQVHEGFKTGRLKESDLLMGYKTIAGMDDEKAHAYVEVAKWIRDVDDEFNYEKYQKWQQGEERLVAAGVSKTLFAQVAEAWADDPSLKSEYTPEGKLITDSKMKKMMAYIGKLNISAEQKTALAYSFYKDGKKIKKYKTW